MDSIAEFTASAARKIARLNTLATGFAPSTDEWQRLNAKASAMGTATVIINTTLDGIIGTLLTKAANAEAIVLALKELAEDTLERLYDEDPGLTKPETVMSVVQVGGQREGYNLALETLRQEITNR